MPVNRLFVIATMIAALSLLASGCTDDAENTDEPAQQAALDGDGSFQRVCGDASSQGQGAQAVCAFLRAQIDHDLSSSASFFTDDVLFNGLVLQTTGRDEVVAGIEQFIADANVTFEIDSLAVVESSAGVERVMALYYFQIEGAEAQPLCDHYTVRDGLITQIDNVFDLSKLPQP